MRSYLLAILLLIPILLYSGQTSIYDIQYTHNSGTDGTFPSPYRNQAVTTTGIVTAVSHDNSGFYLSEPEGGPWRGIFVSCRNREARVGDLIELTGEVFEHFGFTTIRNVRNLTVLSSGNRLPQPTPVTTGELAVREAYEGVMVQLTNVTVVGRSDQDNAWLIDDGSGISRLSRRFLSTSDDRFNLSTGDVISRIIGIVDYRFGEYRLNIRHKSDLQYQPVGVTKPSWGRIKSFYR